jgi:two-component system alkaline phosphatase synthesis response regulator PhoP
MARILVIDDEHDIVRVIVKILGARGHDVDTGRDGVEALARVEADPPDVLIVDANLPGLDGVELVRRLKANPATRHVPVVLMSAAYLSLGDGPAADEYVVKPFVGEVLIANVERLLGRPPSP